MEREPLECCAVCGKDLFDGDKGYATTTGEVNEDFEGFGASDMEPWLTVACEDCGERVSDAVSLIESAPDKYSPEVIEAAPKLLEACEKAFTVIGELLVAGGFWAEDEADLAGLQNLLKTVIAEAGNKKGERR